ncbi:MAG: hypothetical protein KGR98_01780 [Verrucomicrobia bacterium]|nr:hypothetical protein [Verrucomicrobiota bacterium]MDE3098471.1 hypothetical protein [Verrucomicrobiota bacterium]
MTNEQQLDVQALLDGELSVRKARRVAEMTLRDPDAASLHAGLKSIRETLVQGAPRPILAQSREFYWSGIRRGIQELERQGEPRSAVALGWRRALWPIAAMAVCFLVVWLRNPAENGGAADASADTLMVETTQSGCDAATYQDQADGATLVWFSTDQEAPPTREF